MQLYININIIFYCVLGFVNAAYLSMESLFYTILYL